MFAEVNFQNLQLEYLSKRHGLSALNVTSILQDRYGFLWIGTDGGGLNRYDGYSFLHFRQDRSDQTTLSSDRIVNLFEDSQGRIWIATKNSGLDRFDRNSGVFHHYLRDTSDPSSLPHNRVSSICEDNQGNLWFGTDEGLALYSLETDSFLPVESGVIRITSLHRDNKGYFWVGGDTGFSVFDPLEKEILYQEDWENNGPVSTILDYDDRSIWVVCPLKTLRYYWHEDGRIILDAEYDKGGISALADSRGVLWIGGGETGKLYVYRKESSDFLGVSLHASDLTDSTFDQFPVAPALEDRRGSLWFVSSLGAYYIPSSDRNYSTHILGERVSGFAETASGEVLVAADNRAYTWYPDREILKLRTEEAEEYTTFLTGERGPLYRLNSMGLYRLDREEQDFTLLLSHGYDDIDALNSGPHLNLDEDFRGNLWIGTTNGADFYNPLLGRVLHYKIGGEWPLVLADRSDRVWAGTRGSGLYLLDEQKVTFLPVEDFPDKRIWSLKDDSNGDLWIASDGGLYSYSNEQLKRIYGEKAVLSVESDNDGLIWFSTYDALFKLNPRSEELTYILSARSGVVENFLGNASYAARDGSMYFGGEGGFLRLDPKAYNQKVKHFPVLISSFSVLGKERKGEKPIFITEELILSWSDTFFAFEFTTFDYGFLENIRYAYKLEGWDRDWIEVGNRNFASYTNIPGGSYVFRVKSADAGGVWSDDENQASVLLNINTHPLRTWWAFGLYGLSFISILSVLFLFYHNNQVKKLERQKLITEELNKVNRLKDEFLANTTHELRTPIHGIIGLAESLVSEEETISDSTRSELSLIASSGRRLAYLINDILDYSRLKEGDIPLNRSPIKLHRLVNTVILLSRPLVKGKTISLNNKVSHDLPFLWGDISRVQQILHNLIGNALKFTEQGSITVSAQAGDQFATVKVTDTGIGIPEDRISLIWEQFQQIDGTASRRTEGTGLGLSITRKLVELHGGTVGVESLSGAGSTFSFTLPICRDCDDDTSSGESHSDNVSSVGSIIESVESVSAMMETEESSEDTTQLSGARILYVDDNALNRHIMENQLRNTYDLTLCSDGAQALSLLMKNDHPDLVLLDLMMPGMDGFEVCRILREKYSSVELPVIVITASNQVGNLVAGLSSGANDYLSKPYTPRELIARIENQLSLVRTSMVLLEPGAAKSLNHREEGSQAIMLIDFSALQETDDKSRALSRILPLLREKGGSVLRLEGEVLIVLFSSGMDAAMLSAKAIPEASQGKPVYSVIHIGQSRDILLRELDLVWKKGRELNCPVLLSGAAAEASGESYDSRIAGFLEMDFEENFPFYQLVSSYSETDQLFENAVKLFYGRKYDDAFVAFKKYLKIRPKDKSAEHYCKIAIDIMQNNTPES